MKRLALVSILLSAFVRPADAAPTVPDPVAMPGIKAYCLDLNWQGKGRKSKIADPGFMKGANPEAVVAWHKTVGCNVIQTFCVSHNGYARDRNEVTPEQPGLEHDFLRDVVKLGHAEDMVVMGYFSIATNTRWPPSPGATRRICFSEMTGPSRLTWTAADPKRKRRPSERRRRSSR